MGDDQAKYGRGYANSFGWVDAMTPRDMKPEDRDRHISEACRWGGKLAAKRARVV